MNCPKCNFPAEENSRFCKNCGEILAPQEGAFAATEVLGMDMQPDKISGFEPEFFNPQPAVFEQPTSFQNVPAPTAPKSSGSAKTIIIIVTIIVVIGVGVAAFLGIQAKKQEDVYKQQITNGQQLVQQEKYIDAIALYNEAIALKPKMEEAYIALTDVYIKMGEPKKAAKILLTASNKVPKSTMIAQKQQEVKILEDNTKTDDADAKDSIKTDGKGDSTTTEPATTTPEKDDSLVLTQSVPEMSSAPATSSKPVQQQAGVAPPDNVLATEKNCTVRADGGVNLRTGPGTENALILLIPDGKTVIQLGYNSDGGWVYAKYQDKIGWISKEFLRGAT